MKKIVKMSLVAAIATAGLTTANAQALEEAIKNVDVSGTVVYRYNDYNRDDSNSDASQQTNNYKIGLNLSSKVNDDVKLNTRFIVGAPSTVAGTGNNSNLGFATLDAGVNGDQGVEVLLSNVYFTYTGIANTTVNVGKQGLTTPWTVAEDADGNEQTGTGILALSTWGPVTVAGAYFNQTNLNNSGDSAATLNTLSSYANAGANDIWTAAVIGNVGPVTLDAWYLDMADIFDTYTLGAKAAFDLDAVKLGVEARYTSLDLDANSNDNDLLKIIVTAKAGIFDAKLGYATTDKDGGLAALDNDATTAYQTWNMNPNGKADADFWNASIGVQALDSLHISANYSDVEFDNEVDGNQNDEETEIYAQFVYKMSKNLSAYVRYGTYEQDYSDDTQDTDSEYRGRLQVQYSF